MSAPGRPAVRSLLVIGLGGLLLTGCTSFATSSAGSAAASSSVTPSSSVAASSSAPATVVAGADVSTSAPTTAARTSTAASVTEEPTDVATDAPTTTAADHDVEVTYADWDKGAAAVVVGAYLPDVVEDGGRCTLTLTRSGATVTARAEGAADASSTDCLGLQVAGAKLSSGDWQGVVSYASSRTTATSGAFSVTVP